MQENEYSIINRYGDNFTSKEYITNPAIGREEELKDLMLINKTCGVSNTHKLNITKTPRILGIICTFFNIF